jgi:hypothetical protein
MTKTRRNISLDETAEASLKAQTEAGGEASALVEGLLALADLDRALALAALRDARWRPSEVAAACQALSGTSGFRLAVRPSEVAGNLGLAGMSDNQRTAWLQHYGVDVATWDERCEAVASSDELAAAIVVVARLFWADDAVVGRFVTG